MPLSLREVKMSNKTDKKAEVKTADKSPETPEEKPEEAKTADKPEAKPVKADEVDKKPEEAKTAEKTKETQPEKPAKAAEEVKEVKSEAKREQPEQTATIEPAKTSQLEQVKLSGLYAFKLGMSSIYDEKGHFTPVTVLQFKPWFVSQIKTQEKEGYSSVQVACKAQKNNRVSKSLVKHLTPAGFKEGAAYVKEVRQNSNENIKVGQEVSINSLEKGDTVRLTGVSKGHGFTGVVKRWGFKGGPASHGSTTHRSSGSIGNRTEPARVMPGKKMAGHYGVEQMSIRNVKVMDVVSDEKLIVVKGAVPGARNSLVYLHKNQSVEKR